MKAAAFAAIIIALNVLTGGFSAAATPQFTHELKAVNDLTAGKNYAQAIPHAELAVTLAQADPSITDSQRIELLNLLAQLYYLQTDYPHAERTVRQVLELRRTAGSDVHAVAVSEEDLAELLDLQGKFGEAAEFHARADAGLQTILRGGSTPTSALGRHDAAPIIESVYDFYDARELEEPGYGRYTYVVLPPNKERGTALLATLLGAPAGATVGVHNRAVVNAFEIPVAAGRRANARTQSAPAADGAATTKADALWTLYDFGAANNLLLAACSSAASATTSACKDLGTGPYLITFKQPISALAALPNPYLIVDLSNMQAPAFPYIVKTMQLQLEAKDLADIHDAGGIHSTQTGLLNTVLSAKDWLTPVSDSVSQWLKLVPAK